MADLNGETGVITAIPSLHTDNGEPVIKAGHTASLAAPCPSTLRSAHFSGLLIGSPLNVAGRLIGSPITSQNTVPLFSYA